MNKNIIELIKKFEKPGDFTYTSVTDEIILTAEETLNVTLPIQYVNYLKKYGHGGICGIEILGIGLTGRLIFMDTTLNYRDEGLPNNLVVIENVDEWVTCVDCESGKIVSWDMFGGITEDYACFEDYLLDQIENAIENY